MAIVLYCARENYYLNLFESILHFLDLRVTHDMKRNAGDLVHLGYVTTDATSARMRWGHKIGAADAALSDFKFTGCGKTS